MIVEEMKVGEMGMEGEDCLTVFVSWDDLCVVLFCQITQADVYLWGEGAQQFCRQYFNSKFYFIFPQEKINKIIDYLIPTKIISRIQIQNEVWQILKCHDFYRFKMRAGIYLMFFPFLLVSYYYKM